MSTVHNKVPAAALLPAASKPARKRQTKVPAALREADGEGPTTKHWRTYFLARLIETSNITKAAEAAGISVSRVYRVRQDDPEFRRAWYSALAEGYQNLEMELLAYLRDPAPIFKMDVANAIRALERHRQTVAQQRALEDNLSEQDVLASIDAMIDGMRQRSCANTAILIDGRSPERRTDEQGD